MKLEKYNDTTDSITAREFKRLRNFIRIQQQEIADLKAALLEIAHLPSVRMDEGSYIAHKALGKAND